jgi:hypothetical protein
MNTELDRRSVAYLAMLKKLEWAGYDSESSEPACPICEAWVYQFGRKDRLHAHGCALAVLLGSPMEEVE